MIYPVCQISETKNDTATIFTNLTVDAKKPVNFAYHVSCMSFSKEPIGYHIETSVLILGTFQITK